MTDPERTNLSGQIEALHARLDAMDRHAQEREQRRTARDDKLDARLEAIAEDRRKVERRIALLEGAGASNGDLRTQVEDNRVATAVGAALEQAHADWTARRARERAEDGQAVRSWLALGVTAGVALGSAVGWTMQILM